jgi:uncharacterized membrane protein (UPF0127 family)
MKSVKVGFKGKKIDIEARKLSFREQFRGLMFKSRNSENLLFDYPGKWGIHSFFVFFPFLAIWVDDKNNVLEYKIVKPFTFYVESKRGFARLIELPINEKNKKIIDIFLKHKIL